VRRLVAAAVVAVAVLGADPAAAHSCSAPDEIPVGESTTITVGVPAEAQPVVGFDIAVPDGFRLDKADGFGPWRLERDGSQLRYRGGELAPYACATVHLQGAAERQAQLVFPLTVHGQDGSQIRFTSEDPNDLHAAHLVYAGFSPPTTPTEDSGSGGLSGSAIGLAAAAVAIAGAFFLSRRQQGRARKAGARRPPPRRPAGKRPAGKRKAPGTQTRR
jgi:hypothetical protein